MGGTFRDNGWEDREVKVRRQELLRVLQENRTKHLAEYTAACLGYRQLAIAKLEQTFTDIKRDITQLREGQVMQIVLGFNLPVPVSHEKAYDQIIRMMEMSVDEEIQLTAGQFACFVMDDWEWKSAWSASNMGYTAGAGSTRR